MEIILNGDKQQIENQSTILLLLNSLKINKEHAALMINGNIIPSSNWDSHLLKENDEVEIILSALIYLLFSLLIICFFLIFK